MKIKLVVIGFFFCLLTVIGAVSISDTQKPVPLPIDGAFSIQGKSKLSNEEIYKKISDISQTEKVDIYKPIVQDSGRLTYINVDDTNAGQLKSLPITGMYYTLGKVDSNSLRKLTDIGLQAIYMEYPWYTGVILPFNGTLRVLLMLSIYLTLLVVLFVVRTRQIKEGVIRRSLGLPVSNLRRDYVISFAFELLIAALLMIFYATFFGSGFLTYSSKLFFSMLATNLLIVQMIDILTFCLFWLTIKVEKPIEVIKNKAKNRLIFIVWFVVISIIILISGFFLQETKISQSRLKAQINNLEPWHKVKDWKKIELLGVENEAVKNGEINDSETTYLNIASTLKKLDFIYIAPSSVYVPDVMKTSGVAEEFSNKLKHDGITDPEVNKEIFYINQTGANVENKVNGTDYQILDNKVATIYIPDKFKESQKSIENSVVAEQFSGTNFTKENIAVNIIPNGQKIFYFNENGDNFNKTKEISPLLGVADSKSNIVVVLDTDKMIANKDVSLASNIVNNALYSPEAIKKINDLSSHSNFSINPVDIYQTVKLNVQSLEHQIFLSKILQNIIYGIVFLLIYQYTKLFISSKQNDYVKKIILGLSKARIALSSFNYFVIAITTVILLTFMMTWQIELLYIGAVSLIVLVFSILISFKKLSDRYTQILKGDEQ